MPDADREPSISLLADHAGFIDDLVGWYEREWGTYYGGEGPGDARTELESRCNSKRLPVGFVAIEDDRMVGTAALDHDVATGRIPSVVGLLVAPDHRHRGVASALLDFAEKLAGNLGYGQLFMSTSVLGAFLQRRGWQECGDVDFLNNERGKAYVRKLTAN